MKNSKPTNVIETRHLSSPPMVKNPSFSDIMNRDFYIKEMVDGKSENTGISRGWGESTIRQRLTYFNNTFLPALNDMFGKNTPVKNLKEEDYDRLLDYLATQRKRGEGTRARDDRYIYLVLEAAYIAGNIPFNSYRGKSFYTVKDEERQISPTLLKHLTPRQSLLIFRHLTKNPATEIGENIGLFLMQTIGLRNNEAAGVDFGDVRQLSTGKYAMFIYKTAEENRNTRKGGGKSWNAVRDLTLLDVTILFLKQRKEFLKKEILSKNIRDRDGNIIRDVKKLPIACRGKDYATPCSSRDLSVAGKPILMAAHITEVELREIDKYMQSKMFAAEGWDDKDPTTYLFRRSYATDLRLLGVPLSMRKYIIGHKIDDSMDKRVSYENEDKLQEVYDYIKRHYLNRLFGEDLNWKQKSIEDLADYINMVETTGRIGVVTSNAVIDVGGGQTVLLDVEAQQPTGMYEIELELIPTGSSQDSNKNTKSRKLLRVKSTNSYSNRKPSQYVDTTQNDLNLYCKELNKLVNDGTELELEKRVKRK